MSFSQPQNPGIQISASGSTGGQSNAYQSITGNTTLTTANYITNVTSGNSTITLPTAVGNSGVQFVIKNSGSGTVTVNTTSAQTIDGNSTYIINVQYADVIVASNGTNWVVIG